MRSNAEDLVRAVLSPYRTVPSPEKVTTGLMLFLYSVSLAA